MIRKNLNNIYQSTLLMSLGIVHGYSTRYFGDMRFSQSREKFLHAAGYSTADMVTAQQIHGTKIAMVRDMDCGKILKDYDGLVYKQSFGHKTVLGVTFADCVPIFMVDVQARIIGTFHAGWKGTLAVIATKGIDTMEMAGAHRKNIFVSIGPHIGMCCYTVLEDRAVAFQKRFGADARISSPILGVWHLDIGRANYQLLLDAGIPRDHIDAPAVCTSCQIDEFNSFRKDTKKTFGIQLGIITL